jgi:glycosyltransferase involved in cell wall biosynthesis
VIVPTWNRRTTLPAALASAFDQSVPPKEVIVVDDGSTDGTVDFVRRTYAKRLADGSLKLVAAKHQGVSAARNAGLDTATGAIITYLDSDNSWRPEYLAHVTAAYSRHPNALSAYADLLVHDADRACTEVLSRPYDRAALLHRNFIDLNVFSHRRGIRRQRFDLALKRLVDWEFILSVTAERAPLHIVYVGADYHLDKARLGNITHTVPLRDNMARVYRKHRRERVFHGCEPLSFAIKCPAPGRDAGRAWGDLYFAARGSICSRPGTRRKAKTTTLSSCCAG